VSGSCRVTAWAVCVERRGVAVLRSQYIPWDCTELGRRLLWDMVLYVQYVPDCRGGAGLLSQTARCTVGTNAAAGASGESEYACPGEYYYVVVLSCCYYCIIVLL
jgi:hypothetical protein